jgi:dTDP-4-dehydrorhamnose 3,5-epimerase
MKAYSGRIPGLVVIEPRVFGDARGFFFESWNACRYREAGVVADFVQDNLSFSRHGILRGLHFQNPNPQGKLVQVLSGQVLDVAVDLRRSSPTFGQWESIELSAENRRQLWVPPGFAHGFAVLGESALFHYKCTACYSPADECTLLWNDPDLAIDWQVADPLLSDKDRKGVRLRDLPAERLFD